MELHIYRMNEYDWIMAESMEQAKNYYLKLTQLPADKAFDNAHQVPEKNLDSFSYCIVEDAERFFISFREAMFRKITEGTEIPTVFATTEY